VTYTEVSAQLLELGIATGLHTYVVSNRSLNTTALYVIPIRWFIAFEPAGTLNTGRYEKKTLPDGKEIENAMVGEKQIPFDELTPAIIRELVVGAAADLVKLEISKLSTPQRQALARRLVLNLPPQPPSTAPPTDNDDRH